SKVILGTAEYDINFAYTNPCGLFEKNIRNSLMEGETLTKDQNKSLIAFTANCQGLYALEWEKEVGQLIHVKLPSIPDEYKEPKPAKPYIEPKHKRDAEHDHATLSQNELDTLQTVVELGKEMSKYKQLLTLFSLLKNPKDIESITNQTNLARLRARRSPNLDEQFKVEPQFTEEESKLYERSPRLRPNLERVAEVRALRQASASIEQTMDELIKTISIKDISALVEITDEAIKAGDRAFERGFKIKNPIIDSVTESNFRSHLEHLESLASRFSMVAGLQSFINRVRGLRELSAKGMNELEEVPLWDKIKYFFVPFRPMPHLDSLVLESLSKRLLPEEMITNQTRLRKREVTSDNPATVTTEGYTPYDAFTGNEWETHDWTKDNATHTWFEGSCIVESQTVVRARNHAYNLKYLHAQLRNLTENELFVLRYGYQQREKRSIHTATRYFIQNYKSRPPTRFPKKGLDLVQNEPTDTVPIPDVPNTVGTATGISTDQRLPKIQTKVKFAWHWYSYLGVLVNYYTYPLICNEEQKNYYEEIIQEAKDDIRKLLEQPAIEGLITPESEPKTRRRRQSIDHNELAASSWPIVTSNTKLDTMPLGSMNLHHRPLGRFQRGILSEMVGEITRQTVGVLTGNIVSNLISSAIEIINPYSNTNRLGRLEAAYEDMKKNFEIQKQADRGILDNLDKLSNVVQETVERLDVHVKSFPAYTWLSGLIISRLTQSGLDLQRVTDEARRGRIAVEPFARLTGLSFLKDISSAETKLLSVSKVNGHTINFKFRTVIEAPDTHVERIKAFSHWDDLDSTPRYLKYDGAEYIIRNETSNCVKAISGPPEPYITEQCLEPNGEDPAVAQWSIVEVTEDIEKYANESQVVKTLGHNYVYCFPGEILIDKKHYRCPSDVFRIKPRYEFQTAKQKHVPTHISRDAYQDVAIDDVHVGHFRDDSDVIQNLALFDQLRNERKKLRQQTEEISSSIQVRKSSPMFWSILAFALATTMGSAAYCFMIIYLRTRNTWQQSTPQVRYATEPNAPAQTVRLELLDRNFKD
ncbi:Hypothetical predicted protein, partial [Olea europaea subsp. europaea]